ncbi:MAG: phage tail tip lysozyme [Paracoccaceae bacterium]|nr:phage tail tip lysozyme [Paracoccaceae bacterium]
MSRIEDDSWNHAEVIARKYEKELSDIIPRLGPEANAPTPMRGLDAISTKRRIDRLMERTSRFVEQNPEARGRIPTTREEFDAHVVDLRQREVDDMMEILQSAPNDAVPGAETLGRLAAGATDPVSLASIPVSAIASPAVGIGMTVASEAAIGAVSELMIAPRRKQVADDLGLPEPDTATDVLLAGLTSGVLAGGGALIGNGAARYAHYRHERGVATDVSAAEHMSAAEHETAVTEAEQALLDGMPLGSDRQAQKSVGPVEWRNFDFSPAGNASPRSNRVGYVYGRLIGHGMPPHVAAGFVGNFMVEAGPSISPRAVGDSGQAIGLAQWNDRSAALVEFARKRGKDWQDLDTQIDFVMHELETTERAARDRIWATQSPRDAAMAVSQYYERPGVPHNDRRMGYAQSVFDQASGGNVPKWRGGAIPDAPAGTYIPTSRGYTGRGQISVGERQIDVDYEVVEAVTLRNATGHYQPRDRSRITSDLWISDTAARLDPAQLMPSPTADRGAPLVGPDDMIESGNGRYGAILRAYEQHPDRAEAYRRQISEAGFAVPQDMKQPVLIARRRTQLDDEARARLTIEAQDSGVARMNATEIAQTTARAMTADRLATFRPEVKIHDDANRGFLNSILNALPRSERNALFDDGGALNAEGKRKLAQAFFARAWSDDGPIGRDILMRYAELEDAGEMKSLMAALEEAAPTWATMRAEIDAGQIRQEFDITAHVLDALHVIVLARRDASKMGGTIAEAIDTVLAQGDLFSGVNPLSLALLRKFWRDGRAAPQAEIASFLTRYADEARAVGKTGDLLGASPSQVLRAIDRNAFANLPDDIPPIDPPPPEPQSVQDLPPEAFADGAQGPEAELADAQARNDIDAAIAAARAKEDFEMPDGRRVSDILADLDDDKTLEMAIDTCLMKRAS